jgi:hypothetical protein
MALACECGRHRVHMGDIPKDEIAKDEVLGVAFAASCGGSLFSQPAKNGEPCRMTFH